MSSLKNKAISGVVWSSLERLSVQGVQFIIQIIMARILMPEDYGIVAMLAIFLAVFQSLVDSGFSLALVQKSDRSEIDYATVFYFNIGISIILFFVLFFSAPLIAMFYETPILTSVTRIVAFNLLINAFGVVPRAKFTVLVDFKTQAKASLITIIISGAIGIWMAYAGYGVWALVFQSLLNNGIKTLLLWILSKWWPLWTFSIVSFKRLFSFGSKLLLSGLLDIIYRNLYTLVIGKRFVTQELGYYSRADQFAQFPSANLSSIISRVAFPVMCEVQQDDTQFKNVFYKFLRISTFIIFPLMIGLAALAEPFIRLVLTEKWMGIVVLLQILCFAYMWYPVHGLNLMLLQARGRSDLFLRLEIIKKIIGMITLIATIPFGVTVMCLGLVISSVLCLYVNAYYTKKHFSIGLLQQVRDIFPSLLLSVSMGILVFLLTQLKLSDAIRLVLGVSVGCLYYVGIATITKMKEWKELIAICRTLPAKNG
jgi:O-antigen/teichoic acid export membrane protein